MSSPAPHRETGAGYSLTLEPHLAAMTSIHLGGPALAHLEITGPEGFDALPEIHRRIGGALRPFGRGTNIIASDAPLPLLLLSYAGKEISPLSDEDSLAGSASDTALIRAEAGALLPLLVNTATAIGLEGLEGLGGIPGSVGGAVRMNAGSYGSVTGNCLYSVTVFFPDRGVVSYTADQLVSGYRSFALPEADSPYLLISATFALKKGNASALKARVREVLATKRATQPVADSSAGCVFKNPPPMADGPGLPTGKLMELSGFKGYQLGGMAFSAMHANFLVNQGTGTAAAAHDLMGQAKAKVLQDHGIALETEVVLWP